MDSRYSYYFANMAQEERRLAAHGHTHLPDEAELAEHIFDIDDKIGLICGVLGVSIEKDYRGRWCIASPVRGARP